MGHLPNPGQVGATNPLLLAESWDLVCLEPFVLCEGLYATFCGGCSAFVEARKACQWSAKNARDPTGSSGFEHEELWFPRVSPTLVVDFVFERATRSCSARRIQMLRFAGAGLASFMEAFRLVSHFGIKTMILQDLLLSL